MNKKMSANKKIRKGHFLDNNKTRILLGIILFSALIKLLSLLRPADLWWDGASYVGIGKSLWSLGKIGFWNPVRPLILPLILGFFWKLKLDPIFFGRLIQVLAATISVYLIYIVSEKLFNNTKISLLAVLLLAVDPIIFNNTQHLLTSTIAMTFSLLALNYYLDGLDNKFDEKTLILTGVFAALAFLSRLTFALIFIGIFFSLLSSEKTKNYKEKFRKLSFLSTAFFLTWLPYLILNSILYKNPLYPYLRGIYEIGLAGEAINYPLTYYLTSIPSVASISIISLAGLFFLFKDFKDEKNKLLLLLFFLPFLYHMFLVEVKVLRYTIIFLPFLYLITSYGVIKLTQKDKLLRNMVVMILVLSLAQNLALGVNNEFAYSIGAFLTYSQSPNQQYLENNYYNFFDKEELRGATVLSSSPYPVALSDIEMHSFFFPNMIFLDELEKTRETFYVMFSLADNPCDEDLAFCQKKVREENDAYAYILLNYEKIYETNTTTDTYYVFEYSG
ncbi:glycosyltransferase family 39 protein [Candidatus Woesearchaeota archaeon]|nr:glycosyltransferase family 39 protein [Candidatus Woesearchaeota archaeon]